MQNIILLDYLFFQGLWISNILKIFIAKVKAK